MILATSRETRDGRELLAMRGMCKSFHGVPALRAAALTVRRGEVHALVGENGAGKSTLMKILAGALESDAGDMVFDGEAYRPRGPQDSMRRGIHLIYQEFNLVPEMTVAENVFLGSEPRGRFGLLGRSKMASAAADLARRLGLDRSPHCRIAELSVAEQQLVEIARALTSEVKLLAMDEPSAALTEREIERLFEIIRDLRARGVGVVYISHRLDEIRRLCDRATILRDGRTIRTAEVRELSRAAIVRDMVGRDLEHEFPKRSTGPGAAAALRLSGLCGGRGYRDVSLTLHRGEILGLAGLVGSGRTELAMGIIGNPPPRRGEVFVHGRRVCVRNPRHALGLGIALLTEDRKQLGIVPERSVCENIALSSLERFSRFGLLDLRRERRAVGELQAALRLVAADLAKPVQGLSGGSQQKVLLARVLSTGADILIFDEPTRGIDVGAKAEIYALLNELCGRGAAILMISSELPEQLGMADRIAVLFEGRLVGIVDAGTADQETVMALATGASLGG